MFITGVDTHIGKSLATGLLAKYFQDQGQPVITQKWVQTGFPENNDLTLHDQYYTALCPENMQKHRMPYHFEKPVSPHLAAKIENKPINKEIIIESYNTLKELFKIVLIEGSGGALVPYNEKNDFLIDIAIDLILPIVVVVDNRVGVLHQTRATLESLEKRNASIVGIIINQINPLAHYIQEDNKKQLSKMGYPIILDINITPA